MKYSLKTDGGALLTSAITVADFLPLSTYKGYESKGVTADVLAALDEVNIDDKLVKLLKALELHFGERFGGKCTLSLTPHGGYRPEPLNSAVGGAKGSQHKYGRAADIYVRIDGELLDVPTAAVAAERFMYKSGIPGGVGVYAARHKYFHLDTRGRWAAWYCDYSGANCPAQGGRPTLLRKGNRAAGIVLLQRALNAASFPCGAADGIFGAKTESALKACQRANGLTSDGIFGAKTNAKLQLFDW